MRRVALLPLLLAAATPGALLPGCGKTEEPEFGGKPVTEWVAQAQDKNANFRVAAYEALGSFPQDKTAIRALEQVVNNDAAPTTERLLAARSLFRASGDAAKVIAPARAVIRREADSASGFQSVKEAEELVFWLGARAEPLSPDLRYAKDHIRGTNAAANRRRANIQKVIDGIPKG